MTAEHSPWLGKHVLHGGGPSQVGFGDTEPLLKMYSRRFRKIDPELRATILLKLDGQELVNTPSVPAKMVTETVPVER